MIIISLGCFACDQEGSVFNDHQDVPYDDGSGLDDIMDGKKFFFGNLHSHTAYSDGQGTPAEAFAFARDVAGYDFYAVTDHAELVGSSEWEDTGVQADLFTLDGVFVAFRGFEWSHPVGHICVYNTPCRFPRTSPRRIPRKNTDVRQVQESRKEWFLPA